MDEEKLFEKILKEQEKLESEQNASFAREDILEAEELILNLILTRLNPKEAQELQDAYEEYRRVEEEIYKEKGGKTSFEDVKARIPDNLWIQTLSSYFDAVSAKAKDIDLEFEEIWQKIKEEEEKEKFKEVKEKNQIH